MNVPRCNGVTIRCVCCGVLLEPNEDHIDDCVNVALWKNSIVTTAFGGIDTIFTGCAFIIGICDACASSAEMDNRLVKFYDKYKEDLPIEDTLEDEDLDFKLQFGEW